MSLFRYILNFNPRSHEGSDKHFVPYLIQIRDFNPRSHEGSDQKVCCSMAKFLFQSSLPRGERQRRRNTTASSAVISILAPTRGATNINLCTIYKLIFQSSLPRGERRSNGSICLTDTDFNPRSHEGSDQYLHIAAVDVADFNPRSHEGSDNLRIDSQWV